ncbi:prepro-carboxypeptidase Z [Gigaspora margarita]|uniref:Carboxypeptidase n=1 Tax=Gigaspora margarita TaxID=4874 RepID=A0A8H4ART5_GIGMA|nr:prepro-carboxypeptidase Z [Gigaspora margarita]
MLKRNFKFTQIGKEFRAPFINYLVASKGRLLIPFRPKIPNHIPPFLNSPFAINMENFHLSRNSFNNLRFSLFSLQLHFVVIWLLCVALATSQTSSASNFSSSKLCDPTVKQYSGYIQTSDGSNMYFWFLESRNNPTSSPLPLFINDGPGCSSMIGLFQELGPCSSLPNGTNTTINPYSWNNVSNVLFVDQPVGAGFSYGNNYLTSSQQAASDLFEFMQIWFAKFPQYASLPFHIFGESYAGHYIPPFALMILSGTSNLLSVNWLNINLSVQKPMMNLKSIGIGDGWIDPMIQYESLMDYSQQNSCSILYYIIHSGVLSNMSAVYPTCQSLLSTCYNTGTTQDCSNADNYCYDNYFPLFAQNLNCNIDDIRTSYDSSLPED